MPKDSKTFVCLAALGLSVGSGLFASSPELTLRGKLTTTEEEALYGIAILRTAPDDEAPPVSKLHPGSKVTVYPENSPEKWWYIEMESREGVLQQGFVPRSFVNVRHGPFMDVPEDHWAVPALERLKTAGALTGYDSGRFQGEKGFTRFEMAVMLDRYMVRLQKARERIEDKIAKIPMQQGLTGKNAEDLDEVVAQLEKLSQEEGKLKKTVEALRGKVDGNIRRLDGLEGSVNGLLARDATQDRRLDELSSMASQLSAEIAQVRGKSDSEPAPTSALKPDLAKKIERIQELMERSAQLEAKVAALEARDRLAQLLKTRKDNSSDASDSTRFAKKAARTLPKANERF